ncbi:glycosyltransferase family 4 protein [Geoalkalibacter halelectricus]|uniref:glycosyltransferase family 4 protein n=1 Tax=Geoalkalibacter halelectricus TaxID=2847045 RepID=UPI003D1EFE78
MQARKLENKLRGEGLAVLFIPTNPDFPGFLDWCTRIPGLRTFVRFWIYLARLWALRRADVVHVFAASHLYFFISVLPALLMGKALGKRAVLNYRGGEAEVFFERWGRFVRPFLGLADAVVVPSEFLQDVFRRKMALETAVLPNIADVDVFSYRERQTFQPIFVVTRQLEPIYGHETIFEAFARVQSIFPEARLRIAGAGSLHRQLTDRVEELGLTGVEFLGTLSHQQLAEVYNACDIMVNASTADNFPGALIEAFLCGLPVVSTNAGGIPFMVKDQVNGLLVEPGDAAALAEAMMRLVRDTQLGRRLAEDGRRYAQAYRWVEIRKKVMHFYGMDCKKEEAH